MVRYYVSQSTISRLDIRSFPTYGSVCIKLIILCMGLCLEVSTISLLDVMFIS